MTVSRKLLPPFLTSLAFSGSFIAAKYTTTDLTPLATTLLRYLIALFCYVPLIWISKERSVRFRLRHLPVFILLGLSGIVGYHYFFFASLHHTAVANTAIINALSPIITGLMAAAFIRERLGLLNWTGIVIAFFGVVILLSKGDLGNLLSVELNRGDLLMLTAVVCWAIYALIVRRLVQQYSILTVTLLSAAAGVLLLSFLILGEDLPEQLAAVSSESILALLYMGIVASGLGYLLYNAGIKEIGPTRTSGVVYSTVPLLTTLLALLFFSEPITGAMLVSAVLVIAGLQLALRKA